jgi:glycosyltransferase involved in cell wall biosynthesis
MTTLRRLLCVDQFGELGGGQRILLDVVRGAVAAGIDVQVALPDGGFAEQLREAGVVVHRLNVPSLQGHRKGPTDAARFARSLPGLSHQIRRIASLSGAELVYVNGARVVAPALLAGSVCRFVFHAHTAFEDRATRLVTGWTLRRSACRLVITPSPFARRWAHETLAVAPDRLAMIWNWVGDPFFRIRREPRPLEHPDGMRVLVLGRITPIKGQAVALEAFAALPSALRARCTLEIAGPVDEETAGRAYLSELLGRSGREPDVVVRAERTDALQMLSAADICVVPSLFDETFGLVAAEAMAGGVPVIVSEKGALPDVVSDAGVIVPSGDVPALATSLTALLADVERRRTLARVGRERARRLFDRERQVACVLRALRAAAGGPSGG